MGRIWQVFVVFGAALSAAAGPTQSVQLGSVMREKLQHTQTILEAVVTSNWVTLETESRELERLTRDPRWAALKYPEYATHSGAFVRAVQDLHQAAAQRDLDNTPKAYIAVTLQCVACHRYLARERLASLALQGTGNAAIRR